MRTSDELYQQYSAICTEARKSIRELMESRNIDEINFGVNYLRLRLNSGFGDYEMSLDKIILNDGRIELYENKERIVDKDLYGSEWLYIYDEVEYFLNN